MDKKQIIKLYMEALGDEKLSFKTWDRLAKVNGKLLLQISVDKLNEVGISDKK